jgi:hypothetical protein
VGREVSGGLLTADGIVLHATDRLRWACGAPVGGVLKWAESRGAIWTVSEVVPRELFADAR